jgi:aspartyl/asparaginyl beta-hydroxylase (cupin superfamily)
MLKYLQLKELFDVEKMQHEVTQLEGDLWKLHYNTKYYEGNWSILPLRSIGGSIDNIIAVHSTAAENINVYQNTALLNQCTYLKSVLDFFECEKTSARLMKLHAGAVIKEHRDQEMSYEEGEARIHVPVFTNPDVEFFVDDERIIMQEGECWYLNLSLKHRVNNFGDTDRVHLVIDCKVNDWMRNLFADPSLLQKHIAEEKSQPVSKEEKLKIIQQLRLMNTEVSLDMANKMENEL